MGTTGLKLPPFNNFLVCKNWFSNFRNRDGNYLKKTATAFVVSIVVYPVNSVVDNNRAAAQCRFVRNLLPFRAKPRRNF